MAKIPRISLGRKEKRSFFPLEHDVNTTSDFGFCQPTICKYVTKDTKISLKSKTFIRLAPMPVPTFGRIQVLEHTAFVPMTDVFEAFDFQQSNKTVSSALRSYIPTTTDYCSNSWLLSLLFTKCFQISDLYNTDFNRFLSELPFRFNFVFDAALFTDSNGTSKYIHEMYLSGRIPRYVDILNDTALWENIEPVFASNIVNFIAQIIYNTVNPDSSFVSFLNKELLDVGSDKSSTVPLVNNIDDNGAINSTGYKLIPLIVFTWLSNLSHKRSYWNGSDTGNLGGSLYHLSDCRQFNGATASSSNRRPVTDSRNMYIFEAMDIHSSDMTFVMNLPHTVVPGYAGQFIYVGAYATPTGKRLLKTLNGCRITFGRETRVSLPKLFAYYKVYFDKYNPGRNLQWRDTACYKLIHTYYDTGLPSQEVYKREVGDSTYLFLSQSIVDSLRKNLLDFISDIPRCVYVSDLDNITVATDSPVLENTQPDNNSYIDLADDITSLSKTSGLSLTPNSTRSGSVILRTDPNDPYYSSPQANGLSTRFLNTLYRLVNKNSVLGSKVDDYLRAHGISNGLPKTKVIGDDSIFCNVDEVFATINNDSTVIGEYAGKSIGSTEDPSRNKTAPTFHFETDSHGYIIQLLCAVPHGGYVQGSEIDPVDRYDFFQSEFDSLGMEALPQSYVVGRQNLFPRLKSVNRVFGFVPRYFHLKTINNLSNGGFAFNSEQSQFLSYSLDKIFSTGDVDMFLGWAGYPNSDQYFNPDIPCDEELRYIGRYEHYGNFNRVFYDTTGITDNFIVHIIQDLKMYAPMLPIDKSFETYDEESDDSSVTLEHA